MVNTNELKAEIVRQGKTQKQVYEHLGLTKRQWMSRIEKKKFDSDEMYGISNYLMLDNPMLIFFADEVTQ